MLALETESWGFVCVRVGPVLRNLSDTTLAIVGSHLIVSQAGEDTLTHHPSKESTSPRSSN